jgi:CrcB protein
MSVSVVIGLGLLGGVGAIARFLLDGQVSSRVSNDLPYGTFAVNVLGAFVLGVLVGMSLGKDAYSLAGTGFVGAFTTFSTWTFESHRLGEDNRLALGLANFLASLVLGVLAAWAGRQLGTAL